MENIVFFLMQCSECHERNANKMAYTAKDPRPPSPLWHVLYLRETKSWWCGEEDGEEEEGTKVSLKTHATARGMGKKKKKCLAIEDFF